jgi:vacuolar protein sorting-associated protein 35
MNKLWIRMQSSGTKDKVRREAQRHDLNMVVGENLMRLSSLAGVNLEIYSTVVLPKLLELIISCKDAISQQYLVDSVIQVFTDEFHLKNLEKLLEALVSLTNGVDNKALFVTLMERLANYAATDSGAILAADQESNIFLILKKYIDKLLEDPGDAAAFSKILDLQVAFCRFCIKAYPKKIEYVNQILESTAKILQSVPVKNLTAVCLTSVGKLLTIPLDSLALEVLNIPHFPTIMQYLNTVTQREVATKILNVRGTQNV